MSTAAAVDLTTLYETDETAWLDAMSALIERGELSELDYSHLAEYLTDMAARDRREVQSRLRLLLTHLLKWTHQAERRSRSWRATILAQRAELRNHAATGVLRNHAEDVLAEVYADAVEIAAAETGLPSVGFPAACPYTLDQLLTADVFAE
jgi:hypothetical protein